ncbi:MAG TPA: hypothetical protein VFG33_18060 [Kribbella sp.]|uniref:hypothetical protein n=1 Tax=Kribbella sp. TaxID=1871183 RepID=UPI002D793E2B|nr:hypothetical protein [Kribbella sp.]HET6295296.1 hypothetical protein [Kribbella sp.]
MSVSRTPSSSLAELELALVWGAWVELGVSGWQRTHRSWAIDPEPLILRTAMLGDADPRLRDEALDWCIHYWRYVSRVRLRNLLRDHSADSLDRWGQFAATVNKHSKASWPHATRELEYTITGRSSLRSMEQPSRAWLRLRAVFGLGARAEILRYFLSGNRRGAVAVIAENIGYVKRNVADECDSLETAGVLKKHQVGNRFYYALARRKELQEFVGSLPETCPDWASLFEMTSAMVGLEAKARVAPVEVLIVEAHKVARLLDGSLENLDIEDRPTLVLPDDYWPAVRDFAQRYMSAWSAGRWTPIRQQRPPARTHSGDRAS